MSNEESILKLRLAIEEGCLNLQNQRLFGRDITTNRMLEECEMRLFSKIKDVDKVKDKISFLHKVINLNSSVSTMYIFSSNIFALWNIDHSSCSNWYSNHRKAPYK